MKSVNLLGIALLTVLSGCQGGTAANGETSATPAAATTTATETTPQAPAPATAAPAAPAPAATQAPAGDGRSLCAADEDVVISCTLAGAEKKLASLCASKGVTDQSGYVYFAQGAAGHTDYVFPADKSAPARRFKRTQLGFAGNTGGYAYSFEDGGRKRIFYSVSGEMGLEEQGVIVVADGAEKPETALSCEKDSVVRNEDNVLFKFTRSWDRDAQLDKRGLPPRN